MPTRGATGALGLVFCNAFGGIIDPRSSILLTVEIAENKARVEGATVHALRHAAGSAVVDVGYSLPTVRDLLGHSSVSIAGDDLLPPNRGGGMGCRRRLVRSAGNVSARWGRIEGGGRIDHVRASPTDRRSQTARRVPAAGRFRSGRVGLGKRRRLPAGLVCQRRVQSTFEWAVPHRQQGNRCLQSKIWCPYQIPNATPPSSFPSVLVALLPERRHDIAAPHRHDQQDDAGRRAEHEGND